ncbi:hydrogenase maturation protease [Desulfurivibrio sp. D14AmB]|uniref:hydrogenase maturation protease n=1 Tax=Desulfurivibrio sp. D14AmB TaxID=3374370 RepID=UPI00376F3A3A
MANTIVIGLGNPLLADDGVGLQVAGLLRDCLPPGAGVRVVTAGSGGLGLLELMVGYQRALIIDAMLSGTRAPGSVARLAVASAGPARHLAGSHGGDLAALLRLGRSLDLALPERVELIGIEAAEVDRFAEELSRSVAAALPVALSLVRELLALERPSPWVTGQVDQP